MTALICWTLFSVICSNTRKPAGFFFCISMKMVWGESQLQCDKCFGKTKLSKKKKISFSGTLVSAGIGRFMLKLDFWFSSHSYVGTRLTVGTQKWLFSHLCPLSLSIGKKKLHTNSTQRLNEWKHKFSTTKANCVFFQERKKHLRCFGNAV